MHTVATQPAFRERLTTAVSRLLDSAGAPGAAVSLLLDGRPVLEAGIGYRDAARTIPLRPDAPFYLYSITKTLIAAALLQHVARGTLDLDAPIQTYLPDLPLPAPVTVRQLLNHSAALPDYGGLAAYQDAVREHPGSPWTGERFLQVAATTEERPPPWRYSNVGYLILKLLLEKLSESSLQVALHEQLFAPLQLYDTYVAEDLDTAATLTPGYSLFFDPDGDLQEVTRRYHPGWVAHGVVISTAPSLARLFHALFASDLLPAPLRDAMAEPIMLPFAHPLFKQPAYGLGVMIDAASPHGLLIGHAGGGPGYATAALCFPDVAGHDIVAVALANRDAPDLGLAIAHHLALATAEALRS
ncbi:MAG: serine hydrolase domain-containing protein [Anaerolineae bacterium]|nr:serine hydrolase domain-containing protein [Anaerolineae bacterium]